MSINEPPQAAMEAATAHLLYLTFLQIRYLSAPLLENQSSEALIKRREQINQLADLGHGLPGLLAPEHRQNLAEGLRYRWRTASARKRRWMTSCWDDIGYDYTWLKDEDTEDRPRPPAEADDPTPASGG